MEIFWFIPTHGDGRYLGTSRGGRATDAGYLRQIAQAVDQLGFGGALLPTGRSCEDAWIVATGLMAVTQRMRFLVAVRPGLMSPAVAARMAATFDRLSNGRLLVNVVTGGDPVELAGDGLHLDHDARYAAHGRISRRLGELAAGVEANFEGKYLQVRGGKVLFTGVQRPYPPLYFGGSSPAAQRVAAKHVDVYLTWGEPPDQVAEKIAEVRCKAARYGRTLRFGIRLHLIVRETADEAWEACAAADRAPGRRHDRQGPGVAVAARFRGTTAACGACTLATATRLKSARICGPAWDSSVAGPARRSWAMRRPWLSECANTPSWESTRSSARVTRTWKRLIASPNSCFRFCFSKTPSPRPDITGTRFVANWSAINTCPV